MSQGRKGYVLVEGHGEVQAAGNLIARLSADLGLAIPWVTPIRWKNLHKKEGIQRGATFIRHKLDVGALLILRDEDDACPRQLGPLAAESLRELDLPFPSAVVLLHPEYEVLFLPCLSLMRDTLIDGRPGLLPTAEWDGDSWESKRGIKEWLTKHFPRNRSYKPTLDQLALTRMIDLEVLRRSDVPCFGTLERALRFFGQASPGTSKVYPLSPIIR